MQLLKELSESFGSPGFEEDIRKIVIRELDGLVDEIRTDRLGNLIALRRASKQTQNPRRVMLAAHLDEIGFVVKHIEKNGFLKLNPLGGFDPKTLIAHRVLVRTRQRDLVGVIGTKPVHILTDEEKTKLPKLDDLFVDLGLEPEGVRQIVEIGDPVTLWQPFLEFGEMVSGKSLDNRISVWTLIKTLQQLKDKGIATDLYAVFTAQEEVGLRGATVAAFGIDPEIGIAIDVTLACDMPGVPPSAQITQLGKGVAIKICDSASISHPQLVRFLRETAEHETIPYQLEVLPRGGTDAGGIQRVRAGIPVVTVSIPTRYVHSVVETAHKKDLSAGIALLTAALQRLDQLVLGG